MGRSKESFGKKEVRIKQAKKRKEKEKRRLEKKEGTSNSFDDMIAWVDENGNITDTPPDLTKKKEIKAENIEVGTPKSEFRKNMKQRTGRVQNFDESKGYGFIRDMESSDSVFVHINDCKVLLKAGDKVEFEVERGDRGLKATLVKLV